MENCIKKAHKTSSAQRVANRHYQNQYRQNHPERIRANNLRYYARQLIAAGYTVTEPVQAATAGRLAL